MKEYKQNLLIVCLNDEIGQETSKKLAEALSMLYASCKDIVDYEVFDVRAVIEKCGMGYFEQKETAVLEHIADYENCVISVDYNYFLKGEDLFKKKCNFIYLKLKKKQLAFDDTINAIAFEERDEELSQKCEMVFEYKHNSTKTVESIIKILRSEK